VYDHEALTTGAAYLVERLWPRGLRRDDADLDGWLKDAAPSTELRQWFSRDPAKWKEFRRRYIAELDAHPQAWQPLVDAALKGNVALLTALEIVNTTTRSSCATTSTRIR
jgi:uncharacterized protein YeaO (DUF488 family)